MKIANFLSLAILLLTLLSAPHAEAAGTIEKKVGKHRILGYPTSPLLPWTNGKYRVHDANRPVPPYQADAKPTTTPPVAGATVLFDGNRPDKENLANWNGGWKIDPKEKCLVASRGNFSTKEAYGDCQLHLEWQVPAKADTHWPNRGNSGVLLMSKYEIQIYDSHPQHELQLYPDGQAASVYGQTPPKVNVSLPGGKWQSYDITFTAPKFDAAGKLVTRGKVTVLHNGVEVHKDQEIYGTIAHQRLPGQKPHPAKLPLTLQGHGSPVKFRNVWIKGE